MIVFSPYDSDNVGIFDPSDNSYTSGPSHGQSTRPHRDAAKLPDGRVVFPNYSDSEIGLYDPVGDSYSTGPDTGSSTSHYRGAVPLDDGTVVLVPSNADNVGLFDPSDDSHSTGAGAPAGDERFEGGVLADDGRVVFAPYEHGFVGLYDPSSDSYSDGPSHGSGNSLYYSGGAKADDGRIILSPFGSSDIGIFDPSDDSFDTTAHGENMGAFASAATADDGRIIFAPSFSDNVGIFDPSDNSYTSGPAHGTGEDDAFQGAVKVRDGRIIFIPYNADNVGIFDPSDDSYTSGPSHGEGFNAFVRGALTVEQATDVSLEKAYPFGIDVSWTRNDDDSEGSWEVYRSQSSGTLGSIVDTISDPTTTSYSDTGLDSGTEYFYTIRRVVPDATADSDQASETTNPEGYREATTYSSTITTSSGEPVDTREAETYSGVISTDASVGTVDLSRQSETYAEIVTTEATVGTSHWLLGGTRIRTRVDETATHRELSITWRVETSTLLDTLRSAKVDENQVDVLTTDDGGFTAVDRAGGDNTVTLVPPVGRQPLRQAGDYHVTEYEESLVSQSVEEWDVTLRTVRTDDRAETVSIDQSSSGNEWAIDTRLGTIATDHVSSDVLGTGSDGVERFELTLMLTMDQAHAFEVALSRVDGGRIRTLPDASNVAVDDTTDGAASVTLTVPDDGEVQDGDYVVLSWEANRINDEFERYSVEVAREG